MKWFFRALGRTLQAAGISLAVFSILQEGYIDFTYPLSLVVVFLGCVLEDDLL